jgi:exosortase/archaeosortase family protein
MFWGRQLLLAASWPILDADAYLVSWFTGADRVGNAMRAAGGQGFLWVGPPCSSLANLSLAILCWVMFMQIREHRWCRQSIVCAAFASLSVVGINITRIALMVTHPERFNLLHGPIGSSLASWCSIGLVLVVCQFGTRNARLATP